MRRAAITSAVARSAGWGMAGLLVGLMWGLVGMHGAGLHGAGSAGHQEAGLVAIGGQRAEDAGHGPMMAEVVPFSEEPVRLSGTPDDNGPGMAQLCVAVLVGWATLLLLALVARRRPMWVARPGIQMAGSAARARSPGPPSLAQLSLLRC